jgi:D-glycero-D-manno-heptose 1,7-bisphosphate phosphatase
MNLLLVDKDGTLIKTKSGEKFVNKPWDQEALPGVKEALKFHKSRDCKIIIISNQGGVGAGHKSLKDAISEMRFCMELLPEIEECYFCPDFEGESCYRVWADDFIKYNSDSYTVAELEIQSQFRKPNPGMLKLAAHIECADKVWYVGDRPEDEQAAQTADLNFMWADTWRDRFTPGMYEINLATPQQIEFLEGVKISENLVNSLGIKDLLQPPELN